MSKFEEMCNAYATSRKNYFEYRERCFALMKLFVNGFTTYCEIPKDNIRFLPTNEEPKNGSTYSIFGAMHFDNDSFWHLGIEFTLFEKPDVFPHQPVFMVICIKEHNGKVLLKFGRDDNPSQVDLNDEEQRNAYYDRIVKHVKSLFTEGLQRFLDKSAPQKTVGFCPGTN